MIIFDCGNKVVHNDILPHILLKYFDQIDSKVTNSIVLEHFVDQSFTIFDSRKRISNKIITLFPLVAIYLNVTAWAMKYT